MFAAQRKPVKGKRYLVLGTWYLLRNLSLAMYQGPDTKYCFSDSPYMKLTTNRAARMPMLLVPMWASTEAQTLLA